MTFLLSARRELTSWRDLSLALRLGGGVFAIGLACAVTSAQAPHGRTDKPAIGGTIHIVGTDTMKDLMERWISGFRKVHPEIEIEMTAKGSLTAAPALTSGEAQLAPLGREFVPSEIEGFRKAKGYEPTAIAVALGSYDISGRTVALAFYVNAANPLSRLSFEQLDAMYCTTLKRGAKEPVTRWRQLGVSEGLGDQAIHLVGVNYPDGISNFIRLRVCKSGELRTDIHEEHTGGPVNVLDRIVSVVRSDPAAIGYAGFANVQPGTKILAIREDGGAFRKGARGEVANAQYPLTRYIYIYLDRAPGSNINAAELSFLRYVDSAEGQAAVGVDGIFLPLPAAVAAQQLSELN